MKDLITEAVSNSSNSPAVSADSAHVSKRTFQAIHDIDQQSRNLMQVLQDDKQRIGCFLGAGCPLGIYDSEGKNSLVMIPAVVELTKLVAEKLSQLDCADSSASKFRIQWDQLLGECRTDGGKEPTVEDILTELRTLVSRRGSSEVLGMSKLILNELDSKICELISAQMRRPLPNHRTSYNRFASWIGGVHRDSPTEIFTPNYDLLFEQAFEQHPLPHFDGFVGSREPWFDLASIEHDAIPNRWTRLWKLHGSINWEKVEEFTGGEKVTRVVRVTREAAAGKVMIFPSHLKYDQSRRMPYLAMLDRLRAFFHGKPVRGGYSSALGGDDAPRLIVCGYSFLDDHLNEVLLDGLRGNRNAQCFALMHSNLADHDRVVDYATKQGNLTVIARDGAVVGTRVGSYKSNQSTALDDQPWIYADTAIDDAKENIRSRLGDFHYFCLFLERLCGGGVQYAQTAN